MEYVFEFDEAKSAANRDKHGIDFIQAQEIWDDSEIVGFQAKPLKEETRWGAIGCLAGKYWTAIFTWRGATIRLISVRRSRSQEVTYYESQRTRQEI
jgi:uncharacterized protein